MRRNLLLATLCLLGLFAGKVQASALTDSDEQLKPEAPVIIESKQVDDTVYLSWEAVDNATLYSCYLFNQGQYVAVLDSFPETIVGIEIPYVGSYCFSVTAINEYGESEYSETACVNVVVPEGMKVPDAPVIEATMRNDTAVINIEPMEGVTYYSLYYQGNFMGNLLNTVAEIALPEYGEYCFAVTATNLAGESRYSNVECVKYEEVGVEEMTTMVGVYPNPVDDILYIETSSNVEEVAIYNITGVMLRQQTTDNGQQSSSTVLRQQTTTSTGSVTDGQQSETVPEPVEGQNLLSLDMSDLENGIYFVEIKTAEGSVVKRIVKN